MMHRQIRKRWDGHPAAGWCWIGLLLLALLLGGPNTSTAYAQAHQEAAQPLVIPADTVEMGTIATVRRDVVVVGTVQGDVTSWLGAIHISGTVTGDVVTYGGSVTLAEEARVEGHVLTLTGNLNQTQGAQVAGHLIDTQIEAGMLSSMVNFSGQPPATSAQWLGYALLCGMLALLTLAVAVGSVVVWPQRTVRASRTYLLTRWTSLAVGITTTAITALALLPLLAALAITLVGLPLIMLLVLVLQLPYLYGLVVTARALVLAYGPTQPAANITTPLLALLLLLPFGLLGIVAPWVSVGLFYLFVSGGLGAAIVSRGGRLAPRLAH